MTSSIQTKSDSKGEKILRSILLQDGKYDAGDLRQHLADKYYDLLISSFNTRVKIENPELQDDLTVLSELTGLPFRSCFEILWGDVRVIQFEDENRI